MLQKFFEVFGQHPPEDMGTMACTVFGILKAAAVLKMVGVSSVGQWFSIAPLQDGSEAERVAKLVEKSLSSDSALIVKVS